MAGSSSPGEPTPSYPHPTAERTLSVEIVKLESDGTVTVKMTAQEAAEVRADFGYIPFTLVTKSGDKLHSLLEWATPNRSS